MSLSEGVMAKPLVSIYMTRVDAEVWHFDTVEVDHDQMEVMADASYAETIYERIRMHVKEAFYEMGYVFDDDEVPE